MAFKHKMGEIAKCKVTGYEGMIVTRCEWLTGCNTYGLQSKSKDGEAPPERQYFDEGTLEITGKGLSKKDVKADDDGGPSKPVKQTNR